MKPVMNGVALAAALAFATPVWAQASAAAPPRAGSLSATAQSVSAKPSISSSAAKHRRLARKAHRRHVARRGDNVADRLNALELQRVQSAAPLEEEARAGSPHATAGFGSSSPPRLLPPPAASGPYDRQSEIEERFVGGDQ